MKKFTLILLSIFIIIIGLIYWHDTKPPKTRSVVVLSISSDGRYVVGNKNTNLILWDVEKKKRKQVAKNVNIYSAYFVKNTPYYMYQDLDNVVHVKDVNGKEVKTIPLDFPSYGHVITSDLRQYFASDKDYRIVKVEEGKQTILRGLDQSKWVLPWEALKLSLSTDENYLLSAGFSSGGGPSKYHGLFLGEDIQKLDSLVNFRVWHCGAPPKMSQYFSTMKWFIKHQQPYRLMGITLWRLMKMPTMQSSISEHIKHHASETLCTT